MSTIRRFSLDINKLTKAEQAILDIIVQKAGIKDTLRDGELPEDPMTVMDMLNTVKVDLAEDDNQLDLDDSIEGNNKTNKITSDIGGTLIEAAYDKEEGVDWEGNAQESEVAESSIVGSYLFQGGETGIFSLEPFTGGDSLAAIEFFAPAGAKKSVREDGTEIWTLEDGTVLNPKKDMMTRRLGQNIEPFFKDPRHPGELLVIKYRILDGTMSIEDDWSFLDML